MRGCERWIRGHQPLLHGGPRKSLAALQAIHVRQASVQFDHIIVAGARMQPIDVLRNGTDEPPCAMQAHQRAMSRVRFRGCKVRPAE
jgi:hypothetical protein